MLTRENYSKEHMKLYKEIVEMVLLCWKGCYSYLDCWKQYQEWNCPLYLRMVRA